MRNLLMRPLTYLLLPGLAILSITHAQANAPSYLNSNNIDNVLPSANLSPEPPPIKSPAATLSHPLI